MAARRGGEGSLARAEVPVPRGGGAAAGAGLPGEARRAELFAERVRADLGTPGPGAGKVLLEEEFRHQSL